MIRIRYTVKQAETTRRSKRIYERRRGEIHEQLEEGERTNQRNDVLNGLQRTQKQNNDIDYDRVSIHTAHTNSTEDETQRTGDEGRIEGNEENMTLEELRQRFIAERQREDEERVNLIRQNDDLREENLRLHEQRSRSVTRSRSRTSRSSSRQSRSNRRNSKREQTLDNIYENLQEDDNLQDQCERRTVNDRYEQQHERRGRQEDQMNNRLQDATARHRTRYASDNDG
ncbi:trichohyalin-like [Papaver somniferum]|uniref:trichohyalin-like n=1 Tax=Papaver somniferum TaxID=3469 RepID=UPI000E6FFC43|nr:trichohyalin-like [Papaver somniferum]